MSVYNLGCNWFNYIGDTCLPDQISWYAWV